MEAEPAPEIDQPFLRMAVKPPISLHLAKFDRGANKLEGQARVSEFLAHGEPLDFREIGKVADTDASRRFTSRHNRSDACRRCVVAVKFFVIGTFLLPDIDGAANADDPHQIVERTRHRYAHAAGLPPPR